MNNEAAKTKHLIILATIAVFGMAFASFADGWVYDGYGNWLYEENGEFLKATWKNIDGINYYFDTKGYWLETESLAEVKLAGRETVTFTMEGKDYNDRSYKVKVTMPRPIVAGTNADAINEFIKRDFQNAITKFFEETRMNGLFLLTELRSDEMMEARNQRGVIELGYFGGAMFNLYIDTNKLEMWATRNFN